MKKKRSSIGCLFWLALILLVAVIFLFNRKTIVNVIRKTGFDSILTREEREEPPEVVRAEDEVGVAEDEDPTGEDRTEIDLVQIEEPDTQDAELSGTSGGERIAAAEEVPSPETEPKVRNAKLYFIDVDGSGSIALQPVVRSVRFIDSPLTETLKALLSGMLPSELNRELLSLIPEGSEILSVRVDDGIAYISFNDPFRFNSLGREGYEAQLKQIVYTATEFTTVSSVQILIEGKRYDYLGGEGVFIGQPLTRNSF